MYWNCNGVLSNGKLEQIADLINELQIDICLIDETHLVFGNNEDLSAFYPHWVYSNEHTFL